MIRSDSPHSELGTQTSFMLPVSLVVTLVVLTESEFRFSLLISQLLTKAIPVRGAILKKSAQGNLSGLLAFGDLVVRSQRWTYQRSNL